MSLLNYPVPAIGLWRLTDWNLDRQTLLDWTHKVLDMGARVFDLADIYGDDEVEARFGKTLTLEPTLREWLFLISKCDIKLVGQATGASSQVL